MYLRRWPRGHGAVAGGGVGVGVLGLQRGEQVGVAGVVLRVVVVAPAALPRGHRLRLDLESGSRRGAGWGSRAGDGEVGYAGGGWGTVTLTRHLWRSIKVCSVLDCVSASTECLPTCGSPRGAGWPGTTGAGTDSGLGSLLPGQVMLSL